MEDYTELFLRKVEEWEGLIRFASHRYRIPGVLEPDDLYQEGLMILDDMFRKYDFEPDSDDFRKMFKTELWHGLWHVLQKYKTIKRDWRKVTPKDFADIERDLASGEADGLPLDRVTCTFTPEEAYEIKESTENTERFIEMLVDRLDDEARVVLSELIYPRTWDEIPDKYKCTGNDEVYWRVPKKVPQHVLADLLGWPLIRVRRAITRIRKHAKALGVEVGFEEMASAQIGRRKKNARA